VELYHSTSEDFTDFNVLGVTDGTTESPMMELGIHLGTKNQAENRAKTKQIPKEKQNLLKVEIKPKNVVRVQDKGRWTLSSYRNILMDLGMISKDKNIAKQEVKSFDDVLKVLKDNNVDAFVYENKYEGEGESYIVFDNKSIIKKETDAIQEPSAETVDVQEQPGVSEGVREGDTDITAVTRTTRS
jgi:hypothetical protein